MFLLALSLYGYLLQAWQPGCDMKLDFVYNKHPLVLGIKAFLGDIQGSPSTFGSQQYMLKNIPALPIWKQVEHRMHSGTG
ncbi:hypothetical protein [Thiolapillus sp.]